MALATAIQSPNQGPFAIPNANRLTLADLLRTWGIAGPNSGLVGDASGATYTWTTAKVVGVSHAAATCNITLPNETDLTSWPVGEARTLLKTNTSANVIGFVALTNVAFNLAAVNTAITTLIGSATVPGVATGFPRWTVYRASATAYYFFVGS